MYARTWTMEKAQRQTTTSVLPAENGEWTEKTLNIHTTVYRILIKRHDSENYSLLIHQAIVAGVCRGTPLYIFRGISSGELVLEMIELFSARRN
jgi:hypothetical protein